MSSRKHVHQYYSNSNSTKIAKQRAIKLDKLIKPTPDKKYKQYYRDQGASSAISNGINNGTIVFSSALPSLIKDIDGILQFEITDSEFGPLANQSITVRSIDIDNRLNDLIFRPYGITLQNSYIDWHVDAIEILDLSVSPGEQQSFRLPKVQWSPENSTIISLTSFNDNYEVITVNDDVPSLPFPEPRLFITSPDAPHSLAVLYTRYAAYYDWFGPVIDVQDLHTTIDAPELIEGDYLPFAFFRRTSDPNLISKLTIYRTGHKIGINMHVAGIVIPRDGKNRQLPVKWSSGY